jgi:hypothetical protein
MFTSSLRRSAGTALAIAASALVIAACGDDADSATSGSGGSAAESSSTDQDTAQVRLQECLRENGLDIPSGGTPDPGAFDDIDQDQLQEAMDACEDLQQEAFGEAGVDQSEIQDQLARFTQCMRDEGIDVPDIRPGEGPAAGGAEIDQDDPEVQAALEQCQDQLPQGLGAGQTP